ncbi:WASH complex subunit 5-like [Homalodisca vitripennis]|uniref:WASH complex subunit 5-like n=1 Tax=Homalodisca vitripennis TaxID=197043 RepID=UPI001EEB2703|nr:WASH complex subunit 5-like [Homalodisca vitripennis]XP_046688788.1 WASH complex subunit 5-like [Homalodisca vitripennis]
MADDFLAENNNCGQTLLHLVSRGNAIIAELLRLKDYIPPVFKFDTKQDQQKYSGLILDFAYFKAPDEIDKKIESSLILQDLDEELREKPHRSSDKILLWLLRTSRSLPLTLTVISKTWKMESTFSKRWRVYSSVKTEDNFCVKQFTCLALCCWLVDLHIPGDIRERMLVSYYRYSAQRTMLAAMWMTCANYCVLPA